MIGCCTRPSASSLHERALSQKALLQQVLKAADAHQTAEAGGTAPADDLAARWRRIGGVPLAASAALRGVAGGAP